jgi:exopolyphosphatase/guanosine-5'-triphosphate,3'-diphosphate pyrophosphatase
MNFRMIRSALGHMCRGTRGCPGGLTLNAESDAGGKIARPRPPDGAAGSRIDRRARIKSRGGSASLYGALDLGTNNCRLLVAEPGPGGFAVVDAFSRIVRLGEGAGVSGALGAEAMDRTVSALRVCANKLRWWEVNRFRLIATEACRMAANGAAFIERVRDEVGLVLEIIDRETEAKLAVAGAAPLIDSAARSCLVFDIGGGSTELMWLRCEPGNHWIPAGVVTIAERYGGTHVDEAAFQAMRAHVRPLIEQFIDRVRDRLNGATADPDHLLGTSGTVTTISGVHLNLRRYDRSRVDGCWLDPGDVARVTGDLMAMTYAERAASPCIGRERADLVLAGCAILEEVRAHWPASRIRVADRGLREGLLTQMMVEDRTYGGAA